MENFMCGLLALLGQSGGGGCGALPHFREKPQKTIESKHPKEELGAKKVNKD